MAEILIIGYGSPLRGDDAIGWNAAEELERCFHTDPLVRVIATQQLTPELADDVAASSFVLFLDASSSTKPGEICAARIHAQSAGSSFVHNLSPAWLLATAKQLRPTAPEAICITLGGWSFAVGDRISPRAQLRFPELIHEARAIIAEWQRKIRASAGSVASAKP